MKKPAFGLVFLCGKELKKKSKFSNIEEKKKV